MKEQGGSSRESQCYEIGTRVRTCCHTVTYSRSRLQLSVNGKRGPRARCVAVELLYPEVDFLVGVVVFLDSCVSAV